jgi:hypothetical protein
MIHGITRKVMQMVADSLEREIPKGAEVQSVHITVSRWYGGVHVSVCYTEGSAGALKSRHGNYSVAAKSWSIK